MKIFGIFRGFPGLGRVVSGAGLLKQLEMKGHDVSAFSYMAGKKQLDYYNIKQFISVDITDEDIYTIGINPVGKLGPTLIEKIVDENPDRIIIDGEPLLISLLSKMIDAKKIVALLNPADYYNDKIPKSTNLFFKEHYKLAGKLIIHGIDPELKLPIDNYNHIFYTNVIVRPEILDIKKIHSVEKQIYNIGVILGGGNFNVSEQFVKSTYIIGKKIISLAEHVPHFQFNFYCNENKMKDMLISELDSISCRNVHIYSEFISPEEIYNNDFFFARGGRNTIGELLCLNKQGVLFSTGGDHRSSEQFFNCILAEKLSMGRISYAELNSDINFLLSKIPITSHLIDYKYLSGNDRALDIIVKN